MRGRRRSARGGQPEEQELLRGGHRRPSRSEGAASGSKDEAAGELKDAPLLEQARLLAADGQGAPASGAIREAATLDLQSGLGNRSVQELVEHSQEGEGRELESGLRAQMERTLGADFHEVQVHSGPGADQLTRSLHARAVTVGSDIFFREGALETSSVEGRKLLGHELTHVIQQQASPGGSAVQLQNETPGTPTGGEAAADAGGTATATPAPDAAALRAAYREMRRRGGPQLAQFHEEVDRRFWDRTSYKVGERLDPDLPEDEPYVRIWLQVRNEVMAEWLGRGENPEVESVPSEERPAPGTPSGEVTTGPGEPAVEEPEELTLWDDGILRDADLEPVVRLGTPELDAEGNVVILGYREGTVFTVEDGHILDPEGMPVGDRRPTSEDAAAIERMLLEMVNANQEIIDRIQERFGVEVRSPTAEEVRAELVAQYGEEALTTMIQETIAERLPTVQELLWLEQALIRMSENFGGSLPGMRTINFRANYYEWNDETGELEVNPGVLADMGDETMNIFLTGADAAAASGRWFNTYDSEGVSGSRDLTNYEAFTQVVLHELTHGTMQQNDAMRGIYYNYTNDESHDFMRRWAAATGWRKNADGEWELYILSYPGVGEALGTGGEVPADAIITPDNFGTIITDDMPVTAYGATSPAEDMAEAISYYLMDPRQVETTSPIRADLCRAFLSELNEHFGTEMPGPPPIGDFPEPVSGGRVA